MKSYKAKLKDDHHDMTSQTARIFRQLLLSVEFLHHHGWLHGDIKPENVGLTKAQSFYDVVLLDIGSSKFVGSQDAFLDPTPGCGGTVRYLAPERELRRYTQKINVWSLGIVGFELIYGYHPWSLVKNPWRIGRDFERLRPSFNDSYEDAMSLLCTDKPNKNSDCLKVSLLLALIISPPLALRVDFLISPRSANKTRHTRAARKSATLHC
ncbi:hypothetical protein EAF04_007917 [Stromatinia cepivora]|nr:hypothetical protein EAF04_007917 [Stromatinia cepivora]